MFARAPQFAEVLGQLGVANFCKTLEAQSQVPALSRLQTTLFPAKDEVAIPPKITVRVADPSAFIAIVGAPNPDAGATPLTVLPLPLFIKFEPVAVPAHPVVDAINFPLDTHSSTTTF